MGRAGFEKKQLRESKQGNVHPDGAFSSGHWRRERPNRRIQRWLGDCLDKFQKFERGAFDGLGGHLWPQTYFTRDCDVILRYESLASDLNALTRRIGCSVRAPRDFVKPPGWGSTRGDLAPSLSYEVLAKAKVIYREDYLLYERLKRS